MIPDFWFGALCALSASLLTTNLLLVLLLVWTWRKLSIWTMLSGQRIDGETRLSVSLGPEADPFKNVPSESRDV